MGKGEIVARSRDMSAEDKPGGMWMWMCGGIHQDLTHNKARLTCGVGVLGFRDPPSDSLHLKWKCTLFSTTHSSQFCQLMLLRGRPFPPHEHVLWIVFSR